MKHALSIVMVVISLSLSGFARGEDVKDKLTAVKASLIGSQALLKNYEWIETTTVSVKSEQKARTMNRCYYGEDGKLQKVPVVAPPPEPKQRGLRGKIAEKKKEEMTEYMTEAVALVKAYMPPDPARIEAVQKADRLTIQPMQGGAQVRLTLAGYLKANDSLALDIDAKRDRLIGARVATFMESDKEPVTMTVGFSTLNDAIVYPARITLTAEGKNLVVVVENTGYRKNN